MTADIQAVQLALSFGLGLLLGVFYDVYRVWFRASGRRWLKGVGDIIWWLLALLLAALAMYRINGLQLRAFPLVLAALACLAEQALISPRFFPLINAVCRFFMRLCRKIRRLLRQLIEFLLQPLVWPVELAFRLLLVMRCLLLGLCGRAVRLLMWLGAPFIRVARRVYRRLRRAAAAFLAAGSPAAEENPADGE